jgi:SAM-dependent methyltransferase
VGNLTRTVRGLVRTWTPPPVRSFVQVLSCSALDAIDLVAGRRDPLTPPRRLLRLSTDPRSDFRSTGRTSVEFLVAQCRLRPDSRVLDVGCGVGRLAVALSGFLSAAGRYEGFDVVPAQIEWCQRHVAARFPNFQFQLADVRNDAYNPGGHVRAADYVFPYDRASFDIVIVASVFTHLLSPDLAQYVSEVARVLEKGGRCLASFYLLNDRTRRGIAAGTSVFRFTRPIGDCYVHDEASAECAVAHDEASVRALFDRCGLTLDTCHYGAWSTAGTQSQDLVIATARGPQP